MKGIIFSQPHSTDLTHAILFLFLCVLVFRPWTIVFISSRFPHLINMGQIRASGQIELIQNDACILFTLHFILSMKYSRSVMLLAFLHYWELMNASTLTDWGWLVFYFSFISIISHHKINQVTTDFKIRALSWLWQRVA